MSTILYQSNDRRKEIHLALAGQRWSQSAVCYSVRFYRVGRTVAFLGAPERLIQRCMVAAYDEQNHTLLMDTLAKTYGGSRPEPLSVKRANTTLLEVARSCFAQF